ncbi:hypothetical protein LshimejAT787_1202610 [Lyophyllum shimeji]|uniref:Uncharacterized protein n=1 Tax=Lyophyllum shimeji TaxID=47721 RepID=A0A9P3PX04_LYOSH|nr:hypothetical protein LshimejAT787_1202610 [Lyophyllum shimeji]
MSSAGKDNEKTTLDVSEAGKAPKTRRKISRCKRFLLGSGIVTLLATGLGAAYLLVGFARDVAKPHRGLYYKGSLDDKLNDVQVVRPLIGRDQTFDIAVTVWVRTEEEVEVPDEDVRRKSSLWTVKAPSVTPLYSDIVFRGLRLTDKNVFATVNFTLPTAYFRKDVLTNYDLRGSVVLVPTSPSLLDYIVDFDSWIPDIIDTLPVRSWPFPLGSPDRGKKTIADKAVESFGVTVPLIQFHPILSRCEHKGLEDVLDEFEEEDPGFLGQLMEQKASMETTEGKGVLSHHPYVITRTQIRVVDETTPFNRTMYNRKFNHVKRTSCGQHETLRPTAFMCDRSYFEVGHVETQMTLAIPNEDPTASKISLAYSPYISVTKSAVGPKDLLPIPVNREDCLVEELDEPLNDKTEEDKESIDVSWKLSFSGRPYHKLFIAEAAEVGLGRQPSEDLGASEHRQTLGQNAVELAHGLAGIKHSEDVHPRRRFFLSAVQWVLAVAAVSLDALYWFTRTTTVGISVPGTLIRMASLVVEQLSPAIAAALLQDMAVWDWISTAFWNLSPLVTEFLMLKVVIGMRTKWGEGPSWRRWIPVVYRTPMTHAERASQRLDAQINYWIKGSIVASLFLIYYFFEPHNYAVLAPLLPAPHPDDYLKSWLNDAWPYFTWPTDVASKIFQIMLNWKSQKFAGSYQLTAILILLMRAVGFMEFVPMIMGRYDARPVLVAQAFVDFALLSVLAWQAVTLPRVEQKQEELHSE